MERDEIVVVVVVVVFVVCFFLFVCCCCCCCFLLSHAQGHLSRHMVFLIFDSVDKLIQCESMKATEQLLWCCLF